LMTDRDIVWPRGFGRIKVGGCSRIEVKRYARWKVEVNAKA